MIKITCIIYVLCAVLASAAFSQHTSHEFDKISGEDFKINSFKGDGSIEAIVLYDIGTSQFVRSPSGFNLVFKRRTKLRVLSNAGIKYSEIEIPYYQEGDIHEKVKDIEGYTHNFVDGKLTKTPLDAKNIFEEKINESWLQKKFAMPNVKEGSVIEFRYEIVSPYIFNLKDWEFQHEIPTLYSEYVVRTIPFYDYAYIFNGSHKLHTKSSIMDTGIPRKIGTVEYNEMINTFIMKDVPAFDDESFITSKSDYISKIDFQLAKVTNLYGVSEDIITTWPKLCEELLTEGEFMKFLKKSEKKIKSLVNLNDYSALSDNDKIKQAVDYVKVNYRWNERNDKFPQKDFKEFVTEKEGNCANINLFLTSLLKLTGMEAHPVLISTRDHGKVNREYPFHHFFNYVITMVKVGDGYILLDATEPMCPYNIIPFKCINDKGLVVKRDEEQWVDLTSSRISVLEENISLTCSDDASSLTGNFVIVATDYDAFQLRKEFENDQHKIENQINENNLELIDSVRTRNFEDSEKPYFIYFKANCPMDRIGDQVFISPFLNEPISENPFNQKDRSYPIDMKYRKSRKYKSIIRIPEGFELQQLPENYEMDNKWMTIKYEVKNNVESSEIIISAQYILKKAVYEADDYSSLKYMYSELIEKINERIILSATSVQAQKNDN